MNTKKAMLNAGGLFLTMAFIIFALNIWFYGYLEQHFAHYISGAVYVLYLVFIAWALLIFKQFVYEPASSALTNLFHFVVYACAVLASMAILIYSSYWIAAIATGTAP